MNCSKVKIFYKFKIWCLTSCVVGVNIFYSESRCVTSDLKKNFSEYLVLKTKNRDEKIWRKKASCCRKAVVGKAL